MIFEDFYQEDFILIPMQMIMNEFMFAHPKFILKAIPEIRNVKNL